MHLALRNYYKKWRKVLKFLFFTRNEELGKVFENLICSSKDSMKVCDDFLKMLPKILENHCEYDYMIFDGNGFESLKAFAFNCFSKFEIFIPVVLINESQKKFSAVRCLSENEQYFLNPHMECHLPFFKMIETISSTKAFRTAAEYNSINDNTAGKISLRPYKNAENACQKKEKLKINESEHLSPVNRSLFNLFYLKMNKSIYLDEIARVLNLNSRNTENLNNCLYAYISRFKSVINRKYPDFELIRTGKGAYSLILKDDYLC